MIIFVASDHSSSVHVFNNPSRFTVQMPETFTPPKNKMTQGKWYLGLVDIVVPPIKGLVNKWDIVYVTCNQTEGGVVMNEMYTNVLRSFTAGEAKRWNVVRFSPVLYVPLRVTDVRDLTFELRNARGQLLEYLNTSHTDTTKCTVELLWRKDTNL